LQAPSQALGSDRVIGNDGAVLLCEERMSDDTPPPETKLTRTKQAWAREGRFLTGRVARAEA
jgi:hypothetical protein